MIPPFIPNYTPQRLAIKLKSKAESYVRQGHPWVFENSIEKISKEGSAGDLAIIFDQRHNKLLGIGLYDPHSPIAIKLIAHGQSVTIDEAFFERKLSECYASRQPLLETNTDGYRLIFGENDGLPGLICDVYADVAVIKLYSAIWLPYLHWIVSAIAHITTAKAVVLRLSRLLQKPSIDLAGLEEGQILYGELTNPEVIFVEYGVRFTANVIKGHKTGYFLDHRDNRHKVGQMSSGKRVLDVFSYAGGFSTHAAAGGATLVVSIDISKQALALAKQNVALNVDDAPHEIMAMDAFDAMQILIDRGEQFDIVVVDPPSFAKKAADIPVALKSYGRLANLAIQLVAPRGTCVMASCSSRICADDFFAAVETSFDTWSRGYRLVQKTFHDIDHPISFPEGSYLKTGYYVID